jgi:hypothetical protein
MSGMLPAEFAVLAKLNPVRVVALVLVGLIVLVLALSALERDALPHWVSLLARLYWYLRRTPFTLLFFGAVP